MTIAHQKDHFQLTINYLLNCLIILITKMWFDFLDIKLPPLTPETSNCCQEILLLLQWKSVKNCNAKRCVLEPKYRVLKNWGQIKLLNHCYWKIVYRLSKSCIKNNSFVLEYTNFVIQQNLENRIINKCVKMYTTIYIILSSSANLWILKFSSFFYKVGIFVLN